MNQPDISAGRIEIFRRYDPGFGLVTVLHYNYESNVDFSLIKRK